MAEQPESLARVPGTWPDGTFLVPGTNVWSKLGFFAMCKLLVLGTLYIFCAIMSGQKYII